jgi:hypothetical protein
MPEVTRARVKRTAFAVAQIACGDHAERADRRQRARLGTAQPVLAIAENDTRAIRTARQIDVPDEHVTWIAFFCFAWIGRGTTTAAAHIAAGIVVAPLVRPPWVELVHANLRSC